MFLSAAPYLDYSQGGEGERCGKISRPSESIICRRHAARKSRGRGKGGGRRGVVVWLLDKKSPGRGKEPGRAQPGDLVMPLA